MSVFSGEEAIAALRSGLERMRFAFTVVEDPKKPAAPIELIETGTEKKIRFAWAEVERVEEARSTQTGSRYLRVRLDDGRSFAVSGIGLVFSPSFVSTGPLPECPPTASFADFEKLFRHLEHLIVDHHDGHELEALQVFLVLLSFLDGARALGVDVAHEERRLEPILKRLESLGVAP